MNAPRLAYVFLWYPKPSETFLTSEVRGLRAMGLSLRVFTLYGRLPRCGDDDPEVERLGLAGLPAILGGIVFWLTHRPLTTLALLGRALVLGLGGVPRGLADDRGSLAGRLEKFGESLWGALCAFPLARHFMALGVEHVHAPWAGGPATAAWAAARLCGTPFSLAGRAHDIHPPDGLLATKLRAAVFVRVIARCNAAPLERLGGLPKGAVRLIHEITPWRDRPEAPVRMAAPLRLLGLGRFVGKKGFDDLLRACAILAARGMDFRLTLAGDGPENSRLRALARTLGITDRVAFPGFVTHETAGRLLRDADILAAPCRVEASGDRDGLPMVLVEALMNRVPVVATDVAGVTELVEHGVTGVIAPQRDPEGLARAFAALAKDRKAALRMAEAGKKRAMELFDPAVNLGKLARLFRGDFPLDD